ncbi:MAG: DUF2905 family protein [candidate division Zixibacteria bacterium]
MQALGKFLILFGVIIVIAGIIMILAPKIPFLGKLPGDFNFRGKNYSIYFPLMSSIIISIILTIILNLFFRK